MKKYLSTYFIIVCMLCAPMMAHAFGSAEDERVQPPPVKATTTMAAATPVFSMTDKVKGQMNNLLASSRKQIQTTIDTAATAIGTDTADAIKAAATAMGIDTTKAVTDAISVVDEKATKRDTELANKMVEIAKDRDETLKGNTAAMNNLAAASSGKSLWVLVLVMIVGFSVLAWYIRRRTS